MPILGHGVDLVDVARIERMLADHTDRFRQRCFTAGELARGEGSRREAEHLAARFAAKEAVFKALGTGLADGLTWTDVEVITEPSGRPRLRLHARAAEVAALLGITAWSISLTHTDASALASVIAEGAAPR
ncbi:MAG: holo-ACP synthase [Phycisphaerales bacterium]|nr:holo-ACP synthase [Phycisphaerales bacterium]